MDHCLVCRELRGDVPVPGGFLWDDGLVAAFHVPPLPELGRPSPYLGHLLVVSRRHAARFGDLTAAEAAGVGVAAARLSAALTAAGGAEWVHAAVAGRGVPHFHLHLLPRYPETPADVPWHAVDDWQGARSGGAADVAALAERLRSGV